MVESIEDQTSIVLADRPVQLERVRELFREYAASLNFKLCFQDFEEELVALPGEYASPDGCLFLALSNEASSGCVALRKVEPGICEVKRLFVRPEFRNRGLGRKLALAVLKAARDRGYRRMRLSTMPSMVEAIDLYRSLGFVEIQPHSGSPFDGTLCFELKL